MTKEKKPQFEDAPQLRELANQILMANPSELREAHLFKFAIIWSNRKIRHHAGYCQRVAGPVRFQSKLDFIILIVKPVFEKVKPDEKARIVIHELRHIKDGGKGDESVPTVRDHAGDFCEIPEHDKLSEAIFAKIRDQLPILTKLPYQTTMEEQGQL